MINSSEYAFPIIDGHIHYGNPTLMPSLMEIMDQSNIQRLNVVCTPNQQRLSLVPDALHLKAHYPERVYAFGNLDISALFTMPNNAGSFFASYVDILLAMGCDGIKMIEGKPDIRRMLPIPPFDGEIYAPYWQKLAESGTPLVFHVNDPEEFWDSDRIPDWARARGWFYGNGTCINNEEQYSQVLNVLERYLDLKVVFAHFFFLSAQLERLGGYLDRYPNMYVDLTPGIEMYINFSKQPHIARDFFLKYQDRIIYGTDIGAKALLATPEMGIEPEESRARIHLVRYFLESQNEYQVSEEGKFLLGDLQGAIQGIGLPQPVLEKIYFKNFERLVGIQPRRLNPAAIVDECERLEMMIGTLSSFQPGLTGDASIAQMVKSYFLIR